MNFEAVAVRRESATNREHVAPPKISCRKLDFFYGKFQALKNVELDIGERCVTAFTIIAAGS